MVDGDGRPVADAMVALEPPADLRSRFQEVLDFSIERRWNARSGADGRFEIQDAPLIDGAALEVSKVGFANHREPLTAAPAFNLVIKLAAAAVAKGSWAGRVVDPSGQPVAGARVASPLSVVSADDRGEFNIASGGRASATLTAAKAGYQWGSVTVESDGAAGSGKVGIVIRLGDPPLTIAGVVLDDQGKPVPRARVWIDDATWFGSAMNDLQVLEGMQAGVRTNPIVTADADGRFKIGGLLARDYRVGAVDERTLAALKQEGVRAGGPDVTLQFRKSQMFPRIAGQVVNLVGKPIAGVRVFIWRRAFKLDFPRGLDRQQCQHSRREDRRAGALRVHQHCARWHLSVRRRRRHRAPEAITVFEPDPESMRVVAAMRCHMKIELQDPNEAVDGFGVIGPDGKLLEIDTWSGSDVYGAPREKIVAGVSHVVAVSEQGHTLVLFKS